VHDAGAKIFPQLWHVGQIVPYGGIVDPLASPKPTGPSGLVGGIGIALQANGRSATQEDIDAVVSPFGQAAASTQRLGFDGVEIHGAHGYLIDQFLWSKTNLRLDHHGGAALA
jgi:2,4-dienoyl-CoA reductase-like NADH-dependent reductase (Old Yellow Enzyme family)